jgi:ubiquinone/menaquinone biosynthesis C-methylase UbiE
MQRVNYNEIAPLYDEPSRDHAVDSYLLAFVASHPELAPSAMRILDVGCGTGRQLTANRRRFPAMAMVGVDRFTGMLNLAQQRDPSIAWVNGDGAVLPLHTDSFHYACNQFSYPHIQAKEHMVYEVGRVLKAGGRFVMTNIDPWSMPNWIVYQYFPAAREVDYQDFLPVERFVAVMRAAGFVNVHAHRAYRVTREAVQDFLVYASQRHRTSQFMAIADQDYRAGLQHLEQVIANAQGQQTFVDSEFCLVTIVGDKPESRV